MCTCTCLLQHYRTPAAKEEIELPVIQVVPGKCLPSTSVSCVKIKVCSELSHIWCVSSVEYLNSRTLSLGSSNKEPTVWTHLETMQEILWECTPVMAEGGTR